MRIESVQNDKIKHLMRLMTDNRFRKKATTFVVEGKQENERAVRFGYENIEYFICEAIYKQELPKGKIHLVSEKVYQKIAYRGTSEGVVGVYKVKNSFLSDFIPSKESSVIIVEGIEKPGNLGAILRSCEAFAIDALIVTNSKVDFYNPNVIRSSVGCLFGMNIFEATNQEAIDFLRSNEFKIYTTFMDETARAINQIQLMGKSALVYGTEHSGLTSDWLGVGENVLIPMAGTIDSLNLSNAVAIGGYEFLRQKQAR